LEKYSRKKIYNYSDKRILIYATQSVLSTAVTGKGEHSGF
jgi:hypothetical protein